MERFLAAAESRTNEELRALIETQERHLLELAFEWDGYTPLHIACAAGHLNLVRALLQKFPKFMKKKDANGLTPLHIAAARGDAGIVRELTRRNRKLCFKKGLENKIPLHYAVESGGLEVMRALLAAVPDSIRVTTSQNETALHLALKNYQFDAFNWLVEHLRLRNIKGVINLKDNEGNTALHLAVAAKNFRVVESMLDEHALRRVVVDVNAHNNCGRTPLDLLGKEEVDRVIRGTLIAVGAKHGTVRHSSLVLEGESRTDIRNALLVVAGLIASTTYQSVLQPPKFETKVNGTLTEGFRASYASYMTGFFGRDLAYIVFITGNTFGLLISVQMIICLTRDLRIRLPMFLSMTLMVQTYYCHTYYLPFGGKEGKEFGLINVELLSVLPLMIPILLLLFQRRLALALEFYLEKLSLFDHLRDMYYL